VLSLDLSDNELGDGAAAALADVLAAGAAPDLIELRMGGNALGAAGRAALVSAAGRLGAAGCGV
jgi:Ran GTPase-activating protein (RanGAP) involved in mRNA processing and transport